MSLTPSLARGKIGSDSINAALADAVALDSVAFADLPDAADHAGKLVLVSDASGGPTLAFSNGTDWKVVAVLGATVAD